MDKLKLAYASAVSAILTVVYVTAVTIYAEISGTFKTFLADFTGHHWITKSISSVVLYVLVLAVVYAFKRQTVTEAGINKTIWFLFSTAIIGSLLIAGFYFWHFLVS